MAKDTLYHIPYFSSGRVLQLMYELNAIDLVDIKIISRDYLRTNAKLLAKNPQKTLPFFEDAAGFGVTESSAIMTYVLEKYDKDHRLSPKPLTTHSTPEERRYRAHFLQWLFYGPGTIFPIADNIFESLHEVPVDKRDQAAIDRYVTLWKERVVPTLLLALRDGRKFLMGEEFTAADACVGYDLLLARVTKIESLFEEPLIKAYFERLSERKSFKTVYPPIPDLNI